MADETYTGTSGADVFIAPTGDDWTIIGRGGSDTLTGNTGNDTIVGGFGNDVLDGGPGDDVFVDGLRDGVDTVTGGAGFDRIIASVDGSKIGLSSFNGIEEISGEGFANVTIVGSVNADVLDFTGVNLIDIVSINSGGGNDTVTGTAFDDTINGGSGNDTLDGAGGDDVFLAGFQSGFDTYVGGSGVNRVEAVIDNVKIGVASFSGIQEFSAGGFGNVSLLFDNTSQIINLSAVTLTDIALVDAGGGDDVLTLTAGDDFAFGGFGNDTINGGNGSDTLNGGGGLDILNGGQGDDFFLVNAGGAGQDRYIGGSGYDTISGNNDFAKIILTTGSFSSIEEINSGGFVNVTIEGTLGDDTFNLSGILISEGEIAQINGLNGNDIITGSKSADFILGGDGDDRLIGGLGDDILDGGEGLDFLDGGSGSDTITGGVGADTLLGNFGFDTLDGGDDADTISGGGAADTLTGGLGNDIFRDGSANFAGDTITDLTAGDRIQITNFATPGTTTFAIVDGSLLIDPDGAGIRKAVSIALVGTYDAALFSAVSDGAGGTFVSYTG